MFSAPKFYRRKNTLNNPDNKQQVPDSPNMSNMDPGSKSWFQRWNFRQENINTATPEQEKEKEYTYVINDRPLNSVKADLIHAFLSTQDLIHNINSPSLFRCEYRSPEKFISRNVRFKVEILTENNNNASTTSNNAPQLPNNNNNVNSTENGQNSGCSAVLANNININNGTTSNGQTVVTHNQNPSYKILFTLLSGSTRQFHSLCKHICMLIGSNTNYVNSNAHHQRQARLHQQQLKQQQQAHIQQQQQSPKVTNMMNFSTNSYMPQQQQQQQPPNNGSSPSPYSYNNTATSTPIHNSSIPLISVASQHAGSRTSVHTTGSVQSGYVNNNNGSPSITTPISRRNSQQNNSSHPSSPSASLTNALGVTTITASPFIHNKTSHYSNHNQNIQNLQNSPVPQPPASPAIPNHSFNNNNQNQFNGNSQPHNNNRKNSTTSLNSAQIAMLGQYQQQQTSNITLQRQQSNGSNNQNVNSSTGNVFNQPMLFNNNGNNLQQQQSQFNSTDPYAYSLNKNIFQEIYNLNTDINVYNQD